MSIVDSIFNWNEPRNYNRLMDIIKGNSKGVYSQLPQNNNFNIFDLYGGKNWQNTDKDLYYDYDRTVDINNGKITDNPNYHSSAFGEAKGANFMNFGGGVLGPTPDYVPDLVDAMVAAPQRFGSTVGIGAYQGLSELYKGGKKAIGDNFSLSDIPNIFKSVPGSLNKAFRDTEEEMRGYTAARYNRENVDSAADAWRIGQSVDDATHSNIESVSDKAYRFGAGPVYDTVQSAKKFLSNNNPLTNLFNSNMQVNPYDITALGGPRAKGNIVNPVPTVQPTVQPATPVQPTTPAYQPPVQPTAAPTVPTYNPPQGPAGFTRPTRSYAQQAAAVNKKAKSMGVASPIRRSGNKYGFGL